MDGLFWWERVNNTVIEFHLSITSGSRRTRTQIARLVDRDATDCAISPPLTMNQSLKYTMSVCNRYLCIQTVSSFTVYCETAYLISDVL